MELDEMSSYSVYSPVHAMVQCTVQSSAVTLTLGAQYCMEEHVASNGVNITYSIPFSYIVLTYIHYK